GEVADGQQHVHDRDPGPSPWGSLNRALAQEHQADWTVTGPVPEQAGFRDGCRCWVLTLLLGKGPRFRHDQNNHPAGKTMVISARVHEAMPEWEGFAHAVQSRRPDTGTWCDGWTVRDILIHNTGNADEFIRVLEGHLAGQPA